MTASRVTSRTLRSISCSLWLPTCPGTSASGRFGSPRPSEVVPAWPMNPSQTSDEVGTPANSHAALARITAGVQLPQQPIPEMAASTPISLKRCGSEARISRSSEPCVEPNSRQLTKRTPG